MNNDVFLQNAHLIKCQSASIACSVPVWRVSPFTARHRPFGAVSSTAARCCSTARCPLQASFYGKVLRQCELWMSHSANTPPADFLLYYSVHQGGSRAVQRCSISARSEPFQRLLRTHCRAWLSSAVQTSEMHGSDDKVGSANSLNQIHCRASLRCLQMAPVLKWTTFSNLRQ